jgi:hypothetical protein
MLRKRNLGIVDATVACITDPRADDSRAEDRARAEVARRPHATEEIAHIVKSQLAANPDPRKQA